VPTRNIQLLRSRIGKICIAITGANPSELFQKATNALQDSNFLEFRLDYLTDPASALPTLKTFLADHPTATAIATCRRSSDGGRFEGKLLQELDILIQAAAAGCRIVDLPLQSAEALPPEALVRLRQTGAAILLSYHDFALTKDLEQVAQRAQHFEPDFIKIVPTAKHLSDNLLLIRFLEKMADSTNIVGICMGDAGIISRVLGVRAGSAFTFAAASEGDETAPGQISARALLDTYRIDQVDAATKVYGVAGNPVLHSLSPIMLNTAFRRETINAVYLALQTGKIQDLLKLVQEIPLQGFSVTMPLKTEILPFLEHTDPLTAKIGACNTVLRAQGGKLYGFNTDVVGIIRPLEKRLTSLKGVRTLVIGAGGVARAAVFGLRDKGAEVQILNRTPETAQKLARQAGAKVVKREQLFKSEFDIVINATPVGMVGTKTVSPLTAEELRTKFVFDLVYSPLETPLLRLARQKDITVIAGIEMFVQQGARQFEIWTGKPAPEEEMLRVVLHSLRQQATASVALNIESATIGARSAVSEKLKKSTTTEAPAETLVGRSKRKQAS
jgi:3-dehydroquinate dehydratase/shikimate dehydrogenase